MKSNNISPKSKSPQLKSLEKSVDKKITNKTTNTSKLPKKIAIKPIGSDHEKRIKDDGKNLAYYDWGYGRKVVHPDHLEQWAKDWIAWVKDKMAKNEAFRPYQYPCLLGISMQTWYSFMERSEPLREAYQFIKDYIADHHYAMACNNKGNWNAIKMMLPEDPVYEERMQKNQVLETKTDEKPNVTVILSDYPSSGIVPDKKD